jgi:hypothetical protein
MGEPWTICQVHHWHYLILHFVSELSEVRAAMVPITGRGWRSRLFRLNRNEDVLDMFNRRLNEALQRFMVSQQYFVIDFSFADNDCILKVSNVAQMRVEVSQFQKRFVCPSLMTILPARSFQLTGYSYSPPFASNRLILIPGYSSGTLCKAVAVLHG